MSSPTSRASWRAERSAPVRPGPSARPAPGMGMAMAVILCLVVPGMLIQLASTSHYTPLPWQAMLVMIIAGARYAWIVASARRHLYEMVFWLFTYVFMGYAPLVQQRLGDEISTTPRLDLTYFGEAWMVVLAGVLATMVGSSAGRAYPLRRRTGLPKIGPLRTVLLTCLALALSAVYVAKVGPTSLFMNRNAFHAHVRQVWPDPVTSALVGGWSSMGMLVSLVAQLQLLAARPKGTTPWWQYAALTITGVVVAVLDNPFANARFLVGTAALSIAGALGAYATQRRFRAVAVAALLGLVFLFPLLNVFRGSNPTSGGTNALTAMQSGDFDAFAQIINTLDYVDHVGSSQGMQLLGVVLFWVPRSLWPGKPEDTGITLANYKQYGFDNLSAPLWSEFYINAGLVGVLVGFLLLGFVIRVLDRQHDQELTFSRMPSVAGCIFPFYSLIMVRGSLLQATSLFTVALAAIVFISAPLPDVLRLRKPDRARTRRLVSRRRAHV